MRAVSDLAIIVQPGALDQYADAGSFIIHSCERAKDWLNQCIAHGEIDEIVELKSQAEAIRVYTTTKQLGRDAELAAAEIVRRAERGIGVCIRKGQEAGEIATAVEVKRRAGLARQQRVINSVLANKPTPTAFAPQHELSGNGAGIYHLTDGVTDEQFDDAIYEAKSEGNLSRANVVRKVGGKQKAQPPSKLAFPQPPRMGGNRRKHRQQIEALITSVSGALIAFEGVEVLDDSVTAEEAGALIADLSKQIQAITRINRLLKERTS